MIQLMVLEAGSFDKKKVAPFDSGLTWCIQKDTCDVVYGVTIEL